MINRRKDTFIPFKKGDMVWLDTQNIKTNYHSKMEPKCKGPFEIEEVLGPVTYRLKLPTTWQIHNVFHAVLLKLTLEMKSMARTLHYLLQKSKMARKFTKLKLF